MRNALMALIGGSWAVVTSDFVQLLILMPLTLVTAVLSLVHVGGLRQFAERMPSHYTDWSEVARSEIIWLWIAAILIKQFISIRTLRPRRGTSRVKRFLILKPRSFGLNDCLWNATDTGLQTF